MKDKLSKVDKFVKVDILVQEYENIRPLHEQFTKRLAELLKTLLSDARIRIHTLESRTKEVSSFREKLTRPGKSSGDPIKEISDLTGIRIIVYYLDDIEQVSSLIESEFNIHYPQSGDKAQKLAPHEFGYRSDQYIVSLSEKRKELTEWIPYKDFQAEIQVRTVLQHAWAAISHALHYKHEHDVPQSLSRRLFRLAAVLESADDEFLALRQDREEFVSKVETSSEQAIMKMDINSVTLSEYLTRSLVARELDVSAYDVGFVFNGPLEQDNLFSLSLHCALAELETIAELDAVLQKALPIHRKFFFKLKATTPGTWWVTRPFLVTLVVILMHRDRFPPHVLERLGWDPETAEQICDTLSEM
jgi:putative GTP pyrophosphokinase